MFLHLERPIINCLPVLQSFDTLKTDVWVTMRWHDPRLVWMPNSYFGLTSFSITPDMVWTPDVTLYNG